MYGAIGAVHAGHGYLGDICPLTENRSGRDSAVPHMFLNLKMQENFSGRLCGAIPASSDKLGEGVLGGSGG